LFEKSGHSPAFEEPDAFNKFIINEFSKSKSKAAFR
jgi:pimeloyl-ACP methyl ester carboxylesterase